MSSFWCSLTFQPLREPWECLQHPRSLCFPSSHRETRLEEALENLCERILDYSVHAEHKGSLRYAKVRPFPRAAFHFSETTMDIPWDPSPSSSGECHHPIVRLPHLTLMELTPGSPVIDGADMAERGKKRWGRGLG